jgi:hypothetical protein
MMSGQSESVKLSVDEKIVEINRVLDEYMQWLSLDPKRQEPHISEYWDIDREELEKWSDEDCDIAGVELCNHALFVQQHLNRHTAIFNWADENINIMLAKDLDQYTGFGYKEKLYKAVNDNSAAKKLFSVKVLAKQKIDELSFVANRIDSYAKSFQSLKGSKQRGYYNRA